jgi:hypothetical protein
MENKCWMCDCELDEDEVQYCSHCELQMEAEISGEVDDNKMAEDQTYEEVN